MAADPQKLSEALAKDGYAEAVKAGDHASLAAVLNARDDPGRRIAHADMTRSEFVANYSAITDRIGYETDPQKQHKWMWRHNELSHMDTISLSSPSTQVILQDMVADGYADQAAEMLIKAGLVPEGIDGKQLMEILSSQMASIAEAEGIVDPGENVTITDIPEALLMMPGVSDTPVETANV